MTSPKSGGGELSKGKYIHFSTFHCTGPLADAIVRDFGSLEKFKAQFAAQAAAVQGSGWGWLGYNAAAKKLEIATTFNQDPLLHLTPLLGVDVW